MHVIAELEIPELSALRGLLSTRGGNSHVLAPQPFPHASTVPEESVPGGVLESSYGRRRRTIMSNRQIGHELAFLFQNVLRSYTKAVSNATAATRSSIFSVMCVLINSVIRALETLSLTRGDWALSLFRPACPPALTALRGVCPTAYSRTRTGGGVGPQNV